MGKNSQATTRAEIQRRQNQSIKDRELHRRREQSARDRERNQRQQSLQARAFHQRSERFTRDFDGELLSPPFIAAIATCEVTSISLLAADDVPQVSIRRLETVISERTAWGFCSLRFRLNSLTPWSVGRRSWKAASTKGIIAVQVHSC
jgi:hypothetical protein